MAQVVKDTAKEYVNFFEDFQFHKTIEIFIKSMPLTIEQMVEYDELKFVIFNCFRFITVRAVPSSIIYVCICELQL